MRKKIAINVKGNLFFGDERKEAAANEKEETKKDKKHEDTTTESTEITSDKYDSKNMQIIQDALTTYNITNPLIQKAILATIAKESGFKPQIPEKSYKDTSNKRIREIFGARVS